MKQNPIFVIGTPRSGTTLTAKILGGHSRLFMPGETHYFPDIYAQRKSIGNLDNPGARDELSRRLRTLYKRYNEPEDQQRIEQVYKTKSGSETLHAALGSYKEAFSAFMHVQSEAEGKTRWGNNVPKDIFFVRDIVGFFPDAQFILCVRDVRDFLNSYKGKWKVTSAEQTDRVRKLYHPVVTSLLWKANMKQVPDLKSLLGADCLYILRYEELVERPGYLVRKICDYIGESFECQMLDVEYSNSSSGDGAHGINSNSVGRWRDSLSHEEAWIAQLVAGKELVQLGYSKESLSVNPIKVMWWIITTPFALWSGLKANRKNTGPILPYLARRIKSLIS